MRFKTGVIFLIIAFFFLSGCDSMFESWFDTPADERPVRWVNVDGPMGSLSGSGYNAQNPWLGVSNGKLYAAWHDGSSVYFYSYNGDDKKPEWWYEYSYNHGTIQGVSFCVSNDKILYAYSEGTYVYVMDLYGTPLGGTYAGNPASGSVSLQVWNGTPYVIWYDGSYAQMSRYLAATGTWDFSVVDIYGINDSTEIVNRFRSAVIDGNLYAVLIASSATDVVKVRRFDGTGWVTIYSELNYYTGLGSGNYPDIIGYKGNAVTAWVEAYADNRICIRQANTGQWLDGGYEYYPSICWSGDTLQVAQETSFSTVNGNLCILWSQYVTDPLYGNYATIRVAVYREDSNDKVPWLHVSGNDYKGLNIAAGYSAQAPGGTEFEDKLYVIFAENDGLYNVVHVKAAH